MNKRLLVIFLVVLVIGNLIFMFLYFNKSDNLFTGRVILEDFEEKETGFVSKVIDGDTVVINGESVRLLGIDADERGYECYKQAKERLEEFVLNKEVKSEKDGENKDQYERYLRYLFVENKGEEININLKLVEGGLAIARFYPDNKKYKIEILNAENNARKNKIGCKWGDLEYENYEEVEESKEVDEKSVKLGEKEEIELDGNKEGLVGACNAGNYINKEKIIKGLVVGVYKSGSNTIFLNFEKPYPNQCFTGVIFKDYIKEFQDYEDYEGKRVRIKGKIEEYKGKPEIILKKRKQIEIL